MTARLACGDVRAEVSALFDDELDAGAAADVRRHLAECDTCRAYAERIAGVRSSLRLAEAEPVPDLTEEIMARVETAWEHRTRRGRAVALVRTFAVAAVASALVVAGASLPSRDRRGDVASAAEIVRQVRRAARALETYHATFRITERGWHQDVPRRQFRAEVWFDAPERFRLEIDDLTAYPDPEQWPENSVAFVAAPDKVQVREPSRCPVALLPGCTSPTPEVRTLTGRAPFDGRVVLPTDIVVPLATLVGAGGFEVAESAPVAGRAAHLVALELRRAVPLVTSLQPGGSWRSFHPLDEVRLWLDRDTWFPLRFDVVASESPGREQWAAARGYADRPGDVLLTVRATGFDEPESFPPGFFRVPRDGLVTSGAFDADAVGGTWPAPGDTAGLAPYRTGRTPRAVIRTYASGTTWLRVTLTRGRGAIATPRMLAAEEVRLPGGGIGYYRPAGPELRREVDLFGGGISARVEGNLGRAELLNVAASLDLGSRPLPRVVRGPGGIRIARLEPASAFDAVGFAVRPRHLPGGYDPRTPDAALLVRSDGNAPTLLIHYRAPEAEYDGVGLHITETPADRLPPTSGAPSAVDIGNGGRYFAERGELEWIRDGVYYSIRAPSFDLATLLDVARGMR